MDITEIITNITNLKTIFLVCILFIIADIATGYLKALKLRKLNSSVSRDGYIKKVGWFLALLTGLIIEMLINTKVILISSATMCIITEGISFYENLAEIGVNVPYKKYFEKLNNGDENNVE